LNVAEPKNIYICKTKEVGLVCFWKWLKNLSGVLSQRVNYTHF
jgi:hypothetical protein